MTKTESIEAARAAVTEAQANLELAEFALKDAMSLPDDPVLKTWEVGVQANRNAALVLSDGRNVSVGGAVLGTALRQTGLYPDVQEVPVAGDNNRARLTAYDRPAPLSVIYTTGQDEDGSWNYAPAETIEWTEATE